MSIEAGFNEDFLDIFRAFLAHRVEFLVVGAHAMAVHGVPRATGDLDILIRPEPRNAHGVLKALRDFGAPIDAHGISREDFEKPGTVYQIGLPPRRIDLMTGITGVGFDEAWASRVSFEIGDLTIAFIGRVALVQNKKATGRDKDALDVRLLGVQEPSRGG